uniref:Putative adhesin Stv domain-containing protein n=1 Tax=viral metagenome TaxID=1070528 RepID=A0A6C0ENC1_9ZZZZ
MTSLLTKLNPKNINWHKSPHKVTPKISAGNDAKIDELETEQKRLESNLKRGVYKDSDDFHLAWDAQNRSFQRILNHRDRWDEIKSTHPIVNEQREKEKNRFMGKAIAIQKKYENVISNQAEKQGVCGYLSKEPCSKGKDCYWFDKIPESSWVDKSVAKEAGCYSKKEPRKNWGKMKPTKRSKPTTLSTIQENPLAAMQHKQKHNEEKKETKQTLSSSYPDRLEGGKKKTKRRKRRKRKSSRKKRKTKRKRRKRKTRKKKKQKGGSCYNNTNCFFIKGHGTSNRNKFTVPANIEVNFYAPKGQLAPAFYNDIRDACYDIDLKEGGPCERISAGYDCPDYRITNFKGAKQTSESSFYAAPNAGLYTCPPFYENAPTGYKGAELIAPISDNGTTLSEIVMYVSQHNSGTNNVINCNFCRGTKGSYSNQFFNSIPVDTPGTPGGTGATGRFSQQHNKNMQNQYQTNMNQQWGSNL